jgi:hypothetical protein
MRFPAQHSLHSNVLLDVKLNSDFFISFLMNEHVTWRWSSCSRFSAYSIHAPDSQHIPFMLRMLRIFRSCSRCSEYSVHAPDAKNIPIMLRMLRIFCSCSECSEYSVHSPDAPHIPFMIQMISILRSCSRWSAYYVHAPDAQNIPFMLQMFRILCSCSRCWEYSVHACDHFICVVRGFRIPINIGRGSTPYCNTQHFQRQTLQFLRPTDVIGISLISNFTKTWSKDCDICAQNERSVEGLQ